MTITEYSKNLKEQYNKYIILIKYGKFYRAFDYDAFIINYFFNYKISSRYTIGFPKENLNKVLMYLKKNSISSIVINGIDNFIIYEDYILLNNKFKKKLYKKIKIWNYMYNKNTLDMKSFILSYNSYMGHIKHANSYCLKQNINKRIYLLNILKNQ